MSVSSLGSSYLGSPYLGLTGQSFASAGLPSTTETASMQAGASVGANLASSVASGSSASSGSDAESFLMNYANMTPAQQMQASVLSSMGLTQAQYNALPADKQAQIEQMIREKIKEQVQNQTEKKTGMIVDMKA
jgi:hypothetical protein